MDKKTNMQRGAQAACAAYLHCDLRSGNQGAESRSAHPPRGIGENTKLLEVQPGFGTRLAETSYGLVPHIRARTRSLGHLEHLNVVVRARPGNPGHGGGPVLHTFGAWEAVHACKRVTRQILAKILRVHARACGGAPAKLSLDTLGFHLAVCLEGASEALRQTGPVELGQCFVRPRWRAGL